MIREKDQLSTRSSVINSISDRIARVLLGLSSMEIFNKNKCLLLSIRNMNPKHKTVYTCNIAFVHMTLFEKMTMQGKLNIRNSYTALESLRIDFLYHHYATCHHRFQKTI